MHEALHAGLVVAQRVVEDHHDDGWWIVMVVGMVLFWGAIAAAVVWAARAFASHRAATRGETTPLELLDRRLAEGALSVDEYERRREVLLRSSAERPPPS